MNRYRHEYKYYLNYQQYNILLLKAKGFLSLDSHVDSTDSYTIRSLYFDDINNSCFYENEAGSDPRAKYRIRYYNNDISRINLEKKIKTRGMTLKESCDLTIAECQKLISGKIIDFSDNTPTIKKRLLSEMMIKNMMPKIIVTYERIPFVYSVGNVRITFDKNICSSNQTENFLFGNYINRPVLSPGTSILEVKWDEIMPKHIKDIMKLDDLQWTAFSKYYMCRRYHL